MVTYLLIEYFWGATLRPPNSFLTISYNSSRARVYLGVSGQNLNFLNFWGFFVSVKFRRPCREGGEGRKVAFLADRPGPLVEYFSCRGTPVQKNYFCSGTRVRFQRRKIFRFHGKLLVGTVRKSQFFRAQCSQTAQGAYRSARFSSISGHMSNFDLLFF